MSIHYEIDIFHRKHEGQASAFRASPCRRYSDRSRYVRRRYASYKANCIEAGMAEYLSLKGWARTQRKDKLVVAWLIEKGR